MTQADFDEILLKGVHGGAAIYMHAAKPFIGGGFRDQAVIYFFSIYLTSFSLYPEKATIHGELEDEINYLINELCLRFLPDNEIATREECMLIADEFFRQLPMNKQNGL